MIAPTITITVPKPSPFLPGAAPRNVATVGAGETVVPRVPVEFTAGVSVPEGNLAVALGVCTRMATAVADDDGGARLMVEMTLPASSVAVGAWMGG